MMNHHSSNADAWNDALLILQRRMYSTAELTAKLKAKGHLPEGINATVQKLQSYGYLNDREFGRLLAEKYLRAKRYSRPQISVKLRQKGLSDEIIRQSLADYNATEEIDVVVRLIEKKLRLTAPPDKLKIYRYLGSRGFSAATIERAYQQFLLNQQREELE